jgi:glutamate-1-semialdehyde 2,1-aminomutase
MPESLALTSTILWIAAGVAAVALVRWTVPAVRSLPALALVPVISRRLAGWLNATRLTEAEMFVADGAGPSIAGRRRSGFSRLMERLSTDGSAAADVTRTLRHGFSDLRFTDASRVPFPFADVMRARFDLATVVTASRGPYLQGLDGRWSLDVSGSYGLNVAGWERYKDWISQGWEDVKALGPVLGAVHPAVANNVTRLKAISGQDEVSFHMSGTEAVMAAVRLARFNTRRKLIVCFAGAYHGWWDGVQPGLGSERALSDCLTLKDLHPSSLDVIRRRASSIAAVLVNPVQSFHPNAPPPNDAILLTSEMRAAEASTVKYGDWLRQLQAVCREAGVPLILDEVYTGFRLAPGGAQEFFGVQADMVVYGKTVAGGMPIGVVCGRSWLMRRVDPDHPLRMAYVVGTFSAHPLVMGAMRQFLTWTEDAGTRELYETSNRRCSDWVRSTNQRLAEAALPVRLLNLGTIWTVLFKEPSRFNWLFQYYLRAENVTLSWVGTGRCLTSFDFTDEDYAALQTKVLAAAEAMRADGWWVTAAEFPERNRLMRQQLRRELLGGLVPMPVKRFHDAVMKRKDDDHHASHNDKANQYLHLFSSATFIYCYVMLPIDLTQAMFLGLAALFVRQVGHAILEPACHDEEATLLGYNTPSKSLIVLGYTLTALGVMAMSDAWSLSGFWSLRDTIALQWFRFTLAVVFGRVAYLTWKHDLRTGLIWFVKLVTDPFTDLQVYRPWRTQGA